MKNIGTILKRLLPKEVQKPLGRWRTVNCEKQLNRKIELSNEDHCGPCSEYILKKIIVKP